jgi:hypothetical protein
MNRALFAAAILILVSALAGNVPVAMAQPAGPNLIVNGDFEAGNTGFSSDYTYSPGNIGPQGVYDVLSDPSSAHPLATSYGDHTSGSGLMMAVNGATTAGLAVWSQSVAVTTNTDYAFSAWVASWWHDSPAELQFLINGNPVGIFNASSTTGDWQEFSTTWNSGSDTTATVEIVDLNTDSGGNDFTLDDLSLRAELIHVDIDIKPGSDPNAINPRSRGTIPVAILSNATFDATTEVDRTSLTFGRTGDEDSLARCTANEDKNGDGLLDVVCHFSTQRAGFQSGDTEGVLKGMTTGGVPIQGTDSVKIVPPR